MISFIGFHENMLTFNAAEDVSVGAPVMISDNSTVAAGTDGAAFCGVARSVRGGLASVQMSGYMQLPYSGTAPALGVTQLACDGNGGVKAASGRTAVVVDIDTANAAVGFIL